MVRVDISTRGCVLVFVEARSSLMSKFWLTNDDRLRVIWDKVLSGKAKKVLLDSNDVLKIGA